MGLIDTDGMDFLSDLGSTDDYRESAFLCQRLSILIHPHNLLPPPPEDEMYPFQHLFSRTLCEDKRTAAQNTIIFSRGSSRGRLVRVFNFPVPNCEKLLQIKFNFI